MSCSCTNYLGKQNIFNRSEALLRTDIVGDARCVSRRSPSLHPQIAAARLLSIKRPQCASFTWYLVKKQVLSHIIDQAPKAAEDADVAVEGRGHVGDPLIPPSQPEPKPLTMTTKSTLRPPRALLVLNPTFLSVSFASNSPLPSILCHM